LLACREAKALDPKTKTDMNSSTSGWLVLTRNFVAGSHPQNDKDAAKRYNKQAKQQLEQAVALTRQT
jgi:hypothetical protein